MKHWTGWGVVVYRDHWPRFAYMFDTLEEAKLFARSVLSRHCPRIEIDRWQRSTIIEPNVVVLAA